MTNGIPSLIGLAGTIIIAGVVLDELSRIPRPVRSKRSSRSNGRKIRSRNRFPRLTNL